MFVPTAYCCKTAPSLCVQRSRLSGPPKETMIASTCVVSPLPSFVPNRSWRCRAAQRHHQTRAFLPDSNRICQCPCTFLLGAPREKLYLHSHAPGHTVQSAGGFPPTLE